MLKWRFQGYAFQLAKCLLANNWFNILSKYPSCKKAQGGMFYFEMFLQLFLGTARYFLVRPSTFPSKKSQWKCLTPQNSIKLARNTIQPWLLLLTHAQNLQLSNEHVKSLIRNTDFKTNPANKDSCQMIKATPNSRLLPTSLRLW